MSGLGGKPAMRPKGQAETVPVNSFLTDLAKSNDIYD